MTRYFDPWQHIDANHGPTMPPAQWDACVAESFRRMREDGPTVRTGHDGSLHFDESDLPDRAPRMSRRAERDQWRPRTYRVDTDGYDNHGQRVETWEHDGRVEVMW